MEQKMFCFQCEQTAGGTGCTGGAGYAANPRQLPISRMS